LSVVIRVKSVWYPWPNGVRTGALGRSSEFEDTRVCDLELESSRPGSRTSHKPYPIETVHKYTRFSGHRQLSWDVEMFFM